MPNGTITGRAGDILTGDGPSEPNCWAGALARAGLGWCQVGGCGWAWLWCVCGVDVGRVGEWACGLVCLWASVDGWTCVRFDGHVRGCVAMLTCGRMERGGGVGVIWL